MLVVNAGLSLPFKVGIRAIKNIICPSEKTQSCQCICIYYMFQEKNLRVNLTGLVQIIESKI